MRLALALLVTALAACGGEDELELIEAEDAPAEIGDAQKADVASAVKILGGLTLEDATVAPLPSVPMFVAFVVLAPAGAQLQVTAAGGALATKVTLYGPRQPNGNFGRARATGVGSARLTAPADGAYLVVPQPRYVGRSGNATVSVACTGTKCKGSCAATKPSLRRRAWVHTTLSPLTTSNGGPAHRAYDAVVADGVRTTLRAKFSYGAIDKDLEDEDVDLWVRTCPGWQKLATVRTDDDGVAEFTLPAALAAGDYKLLWHVPGDGTTADGTVAFWERGRPIAVTDIDGTLTINDAQVFKQVFTGADPQQYAAADAALWVVRRKGYRLQYLTGRPESLGRMTKTWLAAHRFPPGPARLTDETLEVLPIESGVGDFKTRVLASLSRDVGVSFIAAFGNATTDLSAYQASAIANERLFIIGPHAGERGTTPVSSYAAILPKLEALPYASIP